MELIRIETRDYDGNFTELVYIWSPVGSIEINEFGVLIGTLMEAYGDTWISGMQICTGDRMGTITIR